MKSELKEEILHLRHGDHLCLFYEKDPAERMGGAVGLESDGITGSRFWIELLSTE